MIVFIKRLLIKKKIVVFGDYDVDGVSSTALMCETLSKLGAKYDWYIPNRFTEGYGPNRNAFNKLYDEGTTLLITVDTGIAAVDTVAYANELGLDVIITDHHEVGPEIPNAFAVINPKQKDCLYPFSDLAGVGVVMKVAHALLGEVPKDGLDLVSLGTISDLVPLIDENRYFAKRGLRVLSRLDRPGLQALCELSGLSDPPFTAENVGFGFGPRLNAAGRMSSADPACQILLTTDQEEAYHLAERIEQLNVERQRTVEEITKEAVAMSEKLTEQDAIVVANENWNSGVTGIVASRLVENYQRPSIVIALDSEGVGKGSARSIEGFDLYESLSTVRELFTHFGGHPMAAGLTIDHTNIDLLRAHLNEAVKQTMTDEDFIKTSPVELELKMNDVTTSLIKEIEQLAPFGVKNPKPSVLIRNAAIAQKKAIGSDQTHVKMLLESDGATLDCIGFRKSYINDTVSDDSLISVIGELENNEWRGNVKPQLIIRDAEVRETQVFDMRGKPIQTIERFDHETSYIVFQDAMKQTLINLGIAEHQLIDGTSERVSESVTTFVLIDLPKELASLENVFRHYGKQMDTLYVLLQDETKAYFTSLPTREQFKWLFAYIKQEGTLDAQRTIEQIVRHKGWSVDTVRFMFVVFEELQFITKREGRVELNDTPSKKSLNRRSNLRASS